MKIKKLFIPIISALLCLTLCSCGDNFVYKNSAKTNFNYNNLSAGYSPYWIDNSGVYYSNHNFAFDIYKVNENGQKRIASVSEPSPNLYVYNNKAYFLDSTDDKYLFYEYDLTSDKKRLLTSLKIERIYGYFVLGDSLFVAEGTDNTLVENLAVISLKSGEKTVIAQDVFAYGFTNNTLHYMTKRGNAFSIYKYDNESIKLTSFVLGKNYDETFTPVNFTTDSVIFAKEDSSEIIIYNFNEKKLDTLTASGVIDQVVAFENNAFFVTENSETFVVYCLNLKTKKSTKILHFNDGINLFVASDEDVYVSPFASDGLRRYNLNGEYEDILVS